MPNFLVFAILIWQKQQKIDVVAKIQINQINLFPLKSASALFYSLHEVASFLSSMTKRTTFANPSI